MSKTNLSPVERQLLEFLRQPDGAIFVGAGVSAWSGIPTWSDLLSRMLERAEQISGPCVDARKCLAQGHLLAAADEISNKLTSSEISQILRSDARYSTSAPHEVHDLIFALGIRRFITTNFDCLLEQKAAMEGSILQYRLATHRNLAELADIQKAGANHFIFKLHGDINDAQNIILSESSYKKFLGDRRNPARKALSTIFASRPILFLGYSLSDPDLLMVLDELREEFQGNAGQRWAVIPDPDPAEIERFWQEFRVRIVPYSTNNGSIGSSHQEFIRLLSALGVEKKNLETLRPKSREEILARAMSGALRHSAGFLQKADGCEFNLRARLSLSLIHDPRFSDVKAFSGRSVIDIIENSRSDVIIQGSPGSGKSHSLRVAAQRASKRLVDEVQAGTFGTDCVLPIHIPMQAYRGDLQGLLSDVIPAGLDISALSEHFTILLLLDSIDEAPTDHLSERLWLGQLDQLMANWPNARVVYSTRRADLIGRADLPVFTIDGLGDDEIEVWLKSNTHYTKHSLERVWEGLRNPFALTTLGNFATGDANFESIFALVQDFISRRLHKLSDSYDENELFELLVRLAVNSMSRGRVTMPLGDVEYACSSQIADGEFHKKYLTDDLVRSGIMTSELNGTVRFVHHAITEFFASHWLSSQWVSKSLNLREVLKSRHWDDAISWALNSLDESSASELLIELTNTDFQLAMRALINADRLNPKLWKIALNALSERELSEDDEYEIAYLLEGVDPPDGTLDELRKLQSCSYQYLSAWALGASGLYIQDDEVLELLGRIANGSVPEFADRWFNRALGRRIGNGFQQDLQEHLEACVSNFLKSTSDQERDRALGGITSLVSCIPNFEEAKFTEILPWISKQHGVLRECFVSDVRRDSIQFESYAARTALSKFMRKEFDRGNKRAWFHLYLDVRYGRPWRAPNFTQRRLLKIVEAISKDSIKLDEDGGSKVRWHVGLLASLSDTNRLWKDGLESILNEQNDEELKQVLRCIHPDTRRNSYISLLQRVMDDSPSAVSHLDRAVLAEISSCHDLISEQMVLGYLEKHHLAGWDILSTLINSSSPFERLFEIEELDRWIEVTKTFPAANYTAETIGRFVAENLGTAARHRLIDRSQSVSDADRDHIISYYLHYAESIPLYMVNDSTALKYIEQYVLDGMEPLPSPGARCTEDIINRLVLPWLKTKTLDIYQMSAAQRLLTDAGEAHDKRYFA